MSNAEEYRTTLVGMVDRLISGEWSAKEFRRAYYDFWLEKVPTGLLSAEEEEFFSALQERLDWTTERPTEQERAHGWMDQQEYADWVRLERIRYSSGRGRPI